MEIFIGIIIVVLLISFRLSFLKRIDNLELKLNKLIKQNKDKENTQFFDAYLLLILDSLKKNDLDSAFKYTLDAFNFSEQDRFNLAILESLKQYVYLFKEKKFLDKKKNFRFR